MGRKVFVSYCWAQGEWVWDRLIPALRAGGAEVLYDRERFQAGQAVEAQMDQVQDQAETNVLVLSPEYLTRPACRHEMKRAIARDPAFRQPGLTIPVLRAACTLPKGIAIPNPLYVDLRDDGQAAPWDALLAACGADLGADVPAWLAARDALRMHLGRGQSACLVTSRQPNWKALVAELTRDPGFGDLGLVDLENPLTVARPGLIAELFRSVGQPAQIPEKPHDLVEFATLLKAHARPLRVALLRFHMIVGRTEYGDDLFAALRYVVENRQLVLLLQSRQPITWIEQQYPQVSHFSPLVQTVELKGRA